MEWIVAYLLIGAALAEGCIWSKRRLRQPIPDAKTYALIVAAWPPLCLFALM